MVKSSGMTIADIARMAQVSKSTVSRALSDSPLIGAETKERIQTIARENNFFLNVAAQSLSLKRSNTLAFVSTCYYKDYSVADLFIFEIMSGITDALYARGYDLLMLQVDPHNNDWVRRYLDAGRVDGFILTTSTRKQRHIHALLETGAPFSMWGVPWPDISCSTVTGDNLVGGRLATRHLREIGRQKIAFIGGPAQELEVQQRYRGYEMELQAAGQPVDPALVAYGDFSLTSGGRAMHELLQRVPDLDAAFVCSDLMAIAAMEVIRQQGRRVPEDVAVIGYDDLSIAALNNPSLTTVSQHINQAGRLLAENLLNQLETGVVSNVTLPVDLVKRQSA